MSTGSARIHVCGRLVVEWDGERLERDLPGRQGRLLFAYLVLNRDRPVRRDELIEALWSEEGPPPTGDSLLAPPLSRLRKAIGASRLEGRAELSLALPADAWIDWEVARAGLLTARAAIQRGDWRGAWDPALEAVAIAEGGLLPGLEAIWIDERRRELSDLRVEALEAIAAIGVGIRGASELAAAEAAARAAIESAPFRESARAALMEVLRARGNVAEALMVYDELRHLLMEELGTTPGPSLVQLHERLLMADEEPAPAAAPVAAAPAAGPGPAIGLPDRIVEYTRTPLVGRQAPLQRLRAELKAVEDGGAGLVLLAGEGGIGKTRLAAELACEASAFTVLYGRCDDEELFPFGPWIRMLGGYLERVPDGELPALLVDDGPDLARLLPDLRVRVPELPPPQAGDPESERQHLFGAVTALIERLADRAPILMILDDLHWADRSSLLLARQLIRSTREHRLLVLGTYRDNELSGRHPLFETLADLERDRPLPRLHLDGLDLEEVSVLVGESHASPVDQHTVRTIRDETNGNPFFVKQLARDLEEGGDAARRQSGGFHVPDGLRDVLQSRIGRLPEGSERVLQVASLVGREFDLPIIERVVDMPEDDLLDALDAAVRAGMLNEDTSRPGRYSFAHSLLRKTLEEELTATRRARFHRRIGEAIEARYRDKLDPWFVELARHFGAAGPEEVDRAVSYLLRAAEQAEARLAYDEVVDLSRAALRARERDEPVDETERARLLRQLAGALWLAGRWEEARDTYALSADAARTGQAVTQFAKAALGHAGSAWERFGAEDSASVRLLEEALRMLPPDDSPLRARVLARLGEAIYYSGDSEERLSELVSEAVDMARRVDDLEALADALSAAQYAHWRPGQQDRRLEVAYELVAVAERLGDLHFLAEAYAWRAIVLLELCRRDEADGDLDRHARLAYSLQQPELLMHSAALRSMRSLLTGRWAEGERAALEVLNAGERSRALDARQYFGVEMVQLRNEQGRLGEHIDHFEALLGEVGALPAWRTALAWALLQAGRPDDARAEIDGLRRDGVAALPRDASYLPALVQLAHVATELRDAGLASDIEPLLRPYTDYWVVLGPAAATLGPVAYSVGMLNVLRGQPEKAARYFVVAAEKCELMGARPYLARSQAGLAEALRRIGGTKDLERAATLEEEARAIARELEMTRLLGEVEAVAS